VTSPGDHPPRPHLPPIPAAPSSAEPRRWSAVLAVLAVVSALGVVLVGAGRDAPEGADSIAAEQPAASGEQPADEQAASEEPAEEPGEKPAAAAPAGEPVTLAFGGDVNVEGAARALLSGGLDPVAPILSAADLAVVNLETAVTGRGERADKQYAFRGPVSTFTALRDAGVDVATMANNHGMDYGVTGLRDSLAAARETGMPVVGIGLDEQQAYAPHVATVRGQRIAVLGATQVLDAAFIEPWTARGDKPGLASAKREQRLLKEVRAAREQADTVVVYLHWGRELQSCPTDVQQDLARRLVDAGADVVVGTHAHVLLGGGYLDDAYVDYGLGNFAFAAHRTETARTGVLTLTVQGRAVTEARWTPAVIRSGMPVPLEGAAAEESLRYKQQLTGCTGLAEPPPGG
jgi:poly-gamma-glutamate capsule biosynthesis protein CapA/YwtB (metallophosphatase superfamily)